MDTPATSQKCPASSHLNAEARHSIASVGNIFAPRARRWWEGAYVRDKNTSARHCAKNAGEGGYLRDTTVHKSRRPAKKKQERSGNIHHVNEVRWMQSGHWGGRIQLPKQGTWIVLSSHSFGLQTIAWSKLLVLTSKKLTIKFSTIIEYWSLPSYVHLATTHVMHASRHSPFFTGFSSFHVLTVLC